MATLYKHVENTQGNWGSNIDSSLNLEKVLVPHTEGSLIDVVNNFQWTFTPKDSPSRKETPYIKLEEYYILNSYINQLLSSYGLQPPGDLKNIQDYFDYTSDVTLFLQGAESKENLYEGMYDHNQYKFALNDEEIKPTFTYKFPYFDNPLSTNNDWVSKSAYDDIVNLQTKLAPFNAKIFQTAFEYILNATSQALAGQPGPVTAAFLKVSGSLLNFIQNNDFGPTAQLQSYLNLSRGELFGTETLLPIGGQLGLSFASDLIGMRGIVEQMFSSAASLARIIVQVERVTELLQIASKSPMASIDSDPVIDKPHLWTSTNPYMFNISFPLYNTYPSYDSNWEKTITRNWELCHLLTYQNLYNKRNLYTGIPPVFYSVEVPGVYYTKAAYVNSLNILNVGNVRSVEIETYPDRKHLVNIPDAYYINMTLTDFFMPSRNFLDTINDETRRKTVTQSAGK